MLLSCAGTGAGNTGQGSRHSRHSRCQENIRMVDCIGGMHTCEIQEPHRDPSSRSNWVARVSFGLLVPVLLLRLGASMADSLSARHRLKLEIPGEADPRHVGSTHTQFGSRTCVVQPPDLLGSAVGTSRSTGSHPSSSSSLGLVVERCALARDDHSPTPEVGTGMARDYLWRYP